MNHSTKALTIEEKKARVLAKQAAAVEVAPVAAKDGKQRKRRNVFNGTQGRLSVNYTLPGYHLHVITDKDGRIMEAVDGGYEFVTPDEVGGVSENVVSRNGDLGDRIRFLVNPRGEGEEKYGYLMKQRMEWYEEDQIALQQKNNAIDAAIRRGKISEFQGSYLPQGGITLT